VAKRTVRDFVSPLSCFSFFLRSQLKVLAHTNYSENIPEGSWTKQRLKNQH
jgi:hypothetical protein